MMIRTDVTRRTEPRRIAEPDLGKRFLRFIDSNDFPCVGAKLALARESIQTQQFDTLGDRDNDQALLDGLTRFVAKIESTASDDDTVHSYVAIFHEPTDMTEGRFESLLWSQLSRLHRLDMMAGNHYANDVSRDTDDPRFSFSIAEHPFFIIGLHPGASRIARRFSHPALVFNSHRQFERLKQDGRFEKMQTATRARDIELQGSLNPNLAEFGEASEARQYSGREVEADWRCPFDFKEKP